MQSISDQWTHSLRWSSMPHPTDTRSSDSHGNSMRCTCRYSINHRSRRTDRRSASFSSFRWASIHSKAHWTSSRCSVQQSESYPHTLALGVVIDQAGKWQEHLERVRPTLATTRHLTLKIESDDYELPMVDSLLDPGCFSQLTKLTLYDRFTHVDGVSNFYCGLVAERDRLFKCLESLSQLRSLCFRLTLGEDLQDHEEYIDFYRRLHQFLVSKRTLRTFKFPVHRLNDQTLDYLLQSPTCTIDSMCIALYDHMPVLLRPVDKLTICFMVQGPLDTFLRSLCNVKHIRLKQIPEKDSLPLISCANQATSISINFGHMVHFRCKDLMALCVEQLNLNRTVSYLYNYQFGYDEGPSFAIVDQCIQSHPSIQNKSTWYWDRIYIL
ncbi:hypothetical protein SAMD00019534_121300, partial [Acytostelium subglobosum LB1]|uniref:hypothetical protein n=1 Tax=Acytostelium subglobosum LB1 TaxID=1410327 RepID=UPI000644DF27